MQEVYNLVLSIKPIIRSVIDELRQRHNINGRTIQVADKGLNSTYNIIYALMNADGYIFSKSVKILPEVERTWVLLENNYVDVKNAKGEVLYRTKECIDKFPYIYTDEKGCRSKVLLKEKRVVTYNPKLAKKQRYEINK